MRKFWFVFSIFATIICGRGVHAADDIPACLTAIGNDTTAFVDVLKSEILKGKTFDQKLVDKEKNKLYTLVAANIVTHCIDTNNLSDFNYDIVDANIIEIPFKMDEKYYKLQVNTTTLFEYINLPVGIMVTNLGNKSVGDVITKAETPSDYFFSGECSDHWVRVNIDNDVPVNKAGQTAFSKYAGKEFFIDFPFGKNNRAFPGLIVSATKGIGGSEQVVWYSNYKEARVDAKKFVEALKGTACTTDNLVVDVVSLTTTPVTQGNKRVWGITAEVGAGIGTGISIAGGVAAVAGTVAATTWEVPVAGWIIAAVAGTVALVSGAIAIAPKSLADLEQVMILDGPWKIK